MTVVEGWAQTRWNAGAMLHAEAVFAVVGVLVFMMATVLTARRNAPAAVR
jgi:hypothetical protein